MRYSARVCEDAALFSTRSRVSISCSGDFQKRRRLLWLRRLVLEAKVTTRGPVRTGGGGRGNRTSAKARGWPPTFPTPAFDTHTTPSSTARIKMAARVQKCLAQHAAREEFIEAADTLGQAASDPRWHRFGVRGWPTRRGGVGGRGRGMLGSQG